MQTLKEVLSFLLSAPYLLKREYRTKDGKAWKVTFEGVGIHVAVQMGGSDCVSVGTIRNNVIDDTATFWRKDQNESQMEDYNAIEEIADGVTSTRSINTVGEEWERILGDCGFYGSKVALHFLRPVKTAYSKKEKSVHTVYLFKNARGIHYSQRNRTGYLLDELKDRLIAISKV